MKRPIIEPVETEIDFPNKGTRLEHPAFGQISVSRMSGHSVLYGSDFKHHHSVRLSIHSSVLNRQLSGDWPFQQKELIEIEMSEAQWATFVSSFGQGGGVQCTIRHRNGETIPALPLRDEAKEFSKEMSEQAKAALESLNIALAAVSEAKMSKKDASYITGPIKAAMREIGVNADFVKESFDRHVEERIEKAKVEVNAYMTNAVQRAGLEALMKQDSPLLVLDQKSEEAGE